MLHARKFSLGLPVLKSLPLNEEVFPLPLRRTRIACDDQAAERAFKPRFTNTFALHYMHPLSINPCSL